MTPLMIDIALWYHCRVGDYGNGTGDNNFMAPAVQEAIQAMVSAGLLKENDQSEERPQFYTSTPGLDVYVTALCDVPWPLRIWTAGTCGTP